eukprot:768571-Hanusia_phi.AAC.5
MRTKAGAAPGLLSRDSQVGRVRRGAMDGGGISRGGNDVEITTTKLCSWGGWGMDLSIDHLFEVPFAPLPLEADEVPASKRRNPDPSIKSKGVSYHPSLNYY